MPRILVIADDLTGAAEIGGIAARFGLSTRLLRKPSPPPTSADCVVYDTDSRLLSEAEAASVVARFAEAARAGAFDLVFKKTDSVLRGQPLAEIATVSKIFGRPDVLLLPQNPSRGRCISGGVYTVNGAPLDQTEFARDPLHPATSADAVTLLRPRGGQKVSNVSVGTATISGVSVAEAATAADVSGWADRHDPSRQLAAGGADFFEALCYRFVHGRALLTSKAVLARPLLFVSGTASPATANFKKALDADGCLLRMPNDLYENGDASPFSQDWAKVAAELLQTHGHAMLTVGRPVDSTAGKAALLGRGLAATAGHVLQIGGVRTLAIEGGATAAAVCDYLGWQSFEIEAELATGIVVLRSSAAAPRLVLKPGSYAWPPI